jgi:hypothetical protein
MKTPSEATLASEGVDILQQRRLEMGQSVAARSSRNMPIRGMSLRREWFVILMSRIFQPAHQACLLFKALDSSLETSSLEESQRPAEHFCHRMPA